MGWIDGLYVVGLIVVLFLWKSTESESPKKLLIIVLLINVILGVSTLFSPFNDFSFGAILAFITFSLIFCLNLYNIKFGEKIITLFLLVNILNIVLGFLIIYNNQFVNDILLKSYAAYYPKLVPNMLYDNKPVLMFSSHSRAAFHLFLFFFLSLVGYKHTQKKIFFIFSLCYIFLILNLDSNTGYMFLVFSCLIMSVYLIRYKLRHFFHSIVLGSVVVIFNLNKILVYLNEKYFIFSKTLSSESNGIIGRFSESGILANNFKYMIDNYFRPVGLGYSNDLFYSDSGIMLYTLRGTVILTILIYVGLYMFLKRNIYHKYQVYILFLAVLLMDIGSPTLMYFRTLFIIPFIVVYLNAISDLKIKEVDEERLISKRVWSKASW